MAQDSINAPGPSGGDLGTGLGPTQFGSRPNNGGVDGLMARFIDRGVVGGLSRARDGSSMKTESEIAYEERTTRDAHLLPCPGGCHARRPRYWVCTEEVWTRL